MTITPELVEQAEREARDAARASQVDIREVADMPGLEAVAELFDHIWRSDTTPMTAPLLRALVQAGNYVAGAYEGDELVGAAAGFFGAPSHVALHSHIAGVLPSLPGRAIGYALKLHQRAWCLGHAVPTVEWTFDPLVSRNAHFNLVKLGARPIEYLTNFYGSMNDGINGDDDTDRLLVRWNLVAAPSPAADDAGHIAVPDDIEGMRQSDPDAAKQWRQTLRATLGELMRAGGVVTGFDRHHGYVVEKQGAAS